MTDKKTSAVARQWQTPSTILDMTINRLGQWALLSCGDGSLATLTAADTGIGPQFLENTHKGVSLSIVPDSEDHAFLSSGDDGRLLLIDPEIDVPTQLVEEPNKWIDHVAAARDGSRAYTIGKTLYRLNEMAQPATKPYDLPSSAGGLAYSPDGKRLAVAHNGGVHVFWTHALDTAPLYLKWDGLHTRLMWSPDGEILLSALQGGGVHGWRLGKTIDPPAEGQEMHMQGYDAKVHDLAFSAKGKFLVTSGAPQGVCWPFTDGGPWDKAPLLLGGVDDRRVTRVAPHPVDDMIALGYDDGMIVLAPLDGRMEIMIYPPVSSTKAGVVGLVWNGEADTLVAALSNGQVMLFTMASISKFVRDQNRF